LAARGIAGDEDIVDFAIEVNGEVVLTAQVKSSTDPASNELYPGEAQKVFDRLGPTGATRAMLITNRPPSSGLSAQGLTAFSDDTYTQWTYGDDSSETDRAGNHHRIFRLDNRSVAGLTASLAALVKAFRRDRHFSLGESTARLVSINLLHRIFGAAADAEPQGISALEIVELVTMPDKQIAHALGGFDWGLPVAGIPTFASTVPRVEQLNSLATIGAKIARCVGRCWRLRGRGCG
jgi:hypothetical protein